MKRVRFRTALLVAWDPQCTRTWRRELLATGEWDALHPAHSLAQVKARLSSHQADLVVTDLRLPDGLATDLIRLLREGRLAPRASTLSRQNPLTPHVPVLVMARRQDPLLVDALQEGADGVCDQSAPLGATLAEQARDVMAGHATIAPWIARHLLDHFDANLTGPALAAFEPMASPLELTGGERRLLRQLSLGRRLIDAAWSLNLTPGDCVALVRGMCRKMQWRVRASGLSLQTA